MSKRKDRLNIVNRNIEIHRNEIDNCEAQNEIREGIIKNYESEKTISGREIEIEEEIRKELDERKNKLGWRIKWKPPNTKSSS